MTVSRGIEDGTVSGTKEGVAIVIFPVPVGRNAVPWLDVEREPVLTIDKTAEGSVVPGIVSAAVPPENRSISRGAR